MLQPPPAYRFVIRWPVERGELPGVAARLRGELRGRAPGILVCGFAATDAHGMLDAVVVDAVGRVAVEARRGRWTLQLDDVPPQLSRLIELMGLTPVLL